MSNPIQAPESAQTWVASSLGLSNVHWPGSDWVPSSSTWSSSAAAWWAPGCALDAATRGLKVALVEARDFASGTSSRSSKMFHGGLRYLEQLEFGLVREALFERELSLTTLAPHLVKPLPFLFPLTKRWWERPYMAAGIFSTTHSAGRSRSRRKST